MKKLTAIAASSVVLASLFASISSVAQTTPAPASSTLYCWKNKLYPAGDDRVCNWADNTAEACEGGRVSNVSKDAIKSEPTNIKRCNNGEWLVQVTKK